VSIEVALGCCEDVSRIRLHGGHVRRGRRDRSVGHAMALPPPLVEAFAEIAEAASENAERSVASPA
jgi:hypothetical protein